MKRARPLILVAEDEPLELRLLQTALSGAGYDVIAAEDGQKAITLAIQRRPDLIVLDLYLPNKTGMDALKAIRSAGSLAGTRIIMLSGYIEEAVARQAREGGADAVISKGASSTGDLLEEIRKFIPPPPHASQAPVPALQAPAPRVLSREDVENRLGKLTELKALPFVAAEILQVSADSRSDAKMITETISRDQALTVRILKLANSAFYAAHGRIQNLSQAVTRLGTRGIRDVALAVTMVDQHRKASGSGALDRLGLWRHALACAVLAKDLAAACGADAERIETAFLAGLLHDVGKTALDDVLAVEYPPVLARAAAGGIPLHAAERESFGIDHAEASRKLLTRWQLPAPIVEAAALHHLPAKDLLRRPEEVLFVAGLVQVADTLAKASLTGDGGDRTLAEVPEALAQRLGLDSGRIASVLGGLDQQIQDLTQVLFLHDAGSGEAATAVPSVHGAKALLLRERPADVDPLALLLERLGARIIAGSLADLGGALQERPRALLAVASSAGWAARLQAGLAGAGSPPPGICLLEGILKLPDDLSRSLAGSGMGTARGTWPVPAIAALLGGAA